MGRTEGECQGEGHHPWTGASQRAAIGPRTKGQRMGVEWEPLHELSSWVIRGGGPPAQADSSKGAGRLPQAHSAPPSHLLPGLPFGPAPWNPNANAPCPQGAHACQPPAPEGRARKGEWMGEHAGARLAVLGVAVVSHPGPHPRVFCSGTALLYTRVSPASSCLGPRCSAQRGVGGRCHSGGQCWRPHGPRVWPSILCVCLVGQVPHGPRTPNTFISLLHFWASLCKGKCEREPRKMRLTGQPTLVWEKDSLRGLCDPRVGRAGGAECPCSRRASPAHVPNSSPPGKERSFLPGRQLF